MRKHRTFEEWIKEALSDTDKDHPCTAFSVMHYRTGGGTKEIHTVPLRGKTWDPKHLAALLQGRAETYAQDLGGIQTFELLAFYGNNKEAQATLPFKIVDGELQSGGAARTVKETPDQPGIIAQMMRHNERTADILAGVVQAMAMNSVQREARMYEHMEKLQHEVNESYVVLRDIMMKGIKEDQEKKLEIMKYERETKERQKMLGMAPALANMAAGREIFPQNTADTALIDAIADNAEPAHLKTLEQMGVLPKEIMGPLMVRLSQRIEQKQKEQEALKQLPPAEGETIK